MFLMVLPKDGFAQLYIHKRWHIVVIFFGFDEFQVRKVTHLVITKKKFHHILLKVRILLT